MQLSVSERNWERNLATICTQYFWVFGLKPQMYKTERKMSATKPNLHPNERYLPRCKACSIPPTKMGRIAQPLWVQIACAPLVANCAQLRSVALSLRSVSAPLRPFCALSPKKHWAQIERKYCAQSRSVEHLLFFWLRSVTEHNWAQILCYFALSITERKREQTELNIKNVVKLSAKWAQIERNWAHLSFICAQFMFASQ